MTLLDRSAILKEMTNTMATKSKTRRHILEAYNVNGKVVRYSARLRCWIVDETAYFSKKADAFEFAATGVRRVWEVL